MICGPGFQASPFTGMAWMYLLMSGFHLAPWLKLIGRHRQGHSRHRTADLPQTDRAASRGHGTLSPLPELSAVVRRTNAGGEPVGEGQRMVEDRDFVARRFAAPQRGVAIRS